MDCLFCKIIAGDIPSKKAYEDADMLAFYDIAPQAKVHILVIPKEHIPSVDGLNAMSVFSFHAIISTVGCIRCAETVIADFRNFVYNGIAIAETTIRRSHSMTINEKIKELRKKSGLTQEALAAALNISYQSVSKWESGTASPDIAHLVPLANVFGVTLDELFDRDADTKAHDIETYLARDLALSHNGQIAERIPLWREAVRLYPTDQTCLLRLANALWKVRNLEQFSMEERTAYLGESIAINERLVKEATELSTRFSALQILIYSLSDPSFPYADEEKALEYANMAPSFYCSRELFFEHAYFTEENREKSLGTRHQNILSMIDCASQRIRTQAWETPEERIEAFETVVKLWNTLIPDGNFLFYHCRLAETHTSLANNYAILGNREKAIENLSAALHHAAAYESQEPGEVYYTVPWLSGAYANYSTNTKTLPITETETLKNALSNQWYDFLREDPDFIAIADSLT